MVYFLMVYFLAPYIPFSVYIMKYFNTSKVKHIRTSYKAFKAYFLFLLAAVTSAARLMGCTTQRLMSALSTHKIQAGKDNVAKKLTLQQVCLSIYLQYSFSLYSLIQIPVFDCTNEHTYG